MFDIAQISSYQIVHGNNMKSLPDKPITEMGAKEARTTSD
jgi:hypothetical protein